MASIGFIAVTVMCFIEGFDKWVYYYPLVLLMFGMYFFKAWMKTYGKTHRIHEGKRVFESKQIIIDFICLKINS
jgi:hypothetical protein